MYANSSTARRIPTLLMDWAVAGITPPSPAPDLPVPEKPSPLPPEMPTPTQPLEAPAPMENPVPIREPGTTYSPQAHETEHDSRSVHAEYASA